MLFRILASSVAVFLCSASVSVQAAEGITGEQAMTFINDTRAYTALSSGIAAGVATRHLVPEVPPDKIPEALADYEAKLRAQYQEMRDKPVLPAEAQKWLSENRKRMEAATGKSGFSDGDVVEWAIRKAVEDRGKMHDALSRDITVVHRFEIAWNGTLLSEKLETLGQVVNGVDSQLTGLKTHFVHDGSAFRRYKQGRDGYTVGTIDDLPTLRSSSELDMLLRKGASDNLRRLKGDMFRAGYYQDSPEGRAAYMVFQSGDLCWRVGVLPDDGGRVCSYEVFRKNLPVMLAKYSGFNDAGGGKRYPSHISYTEVQSAELPDEVKDRLLSGELKAYSAEVLNAAILKAADSWDIRVERIVADAKIDESVFTLTFPEGTKVQDKRGGNAVQYTIKGISDQDAVASLDASGGPRGVAANTTPSAQDVARVPAGKDSQRSSSTPEEDKVGGRELILYILVGCLALLAVVALSRRFIMAGRRIKQP